MKIGNKDSIGIRSIETQIPVLSPEWYYIYENQHVFLGKSFFFLMFLQTKNIIVEMKKT